MSIKADSKAWQQSGKPQNEAKNFNNAIHEPIFFEDIDMDVVDILPPPELHLLLGVVLLL